MKRVQVYYSGRVQGVGFRYTVQRLVGGMAIGGFVRNLTDGRVELIADGDTAVVDRLLEEIHSHFSESICDAEIRSAETNEVFAGFEIRR